MPLQYKLQNQERFAFYFWEVVMFYFLYKEELHCHSFLRLFASTNCTIVYSSDHLQQWYVELL